MTLFNFQEDPLMKHALPTANVATLQLATDGNWETALILSRNNTGINFQLALDWTEVAGEDVAVEAFFPDELGLGFLGVRLKPLSAGLRRTVILDLVRIFDKPNAMLTTDFVAVLESAIRQALYEDTPCGLEIGKVNAWRTFGPAKFWPSDAHDSPLESFQTMMSNNPRFKEPSTLPLAIEYQFDRPVPHWYALPVSRTINESQRICEKSVAKILHDFDSCIA